MCASPSRHVLEQVALSSDKNKSEREDGSLLLPLRVVDWVLLALTSPNCWYRSVSKQGV